MLRLTIATVAIMALLFSMVLTGCGGKEAEDKPSTATPQIVAPPDAAADVDYSKYGDHADDAREIHAVVIDVIERLRYGDKTGLYENEFEYFRNEKTYDDYLIHGEVKWANADSLDHIEISDITFFERDSAWVQANFFMPNAAGDLTASPMRLQAYYQQGRWIKPYMSRMSFQLEFEEKVHQADQDVDEDW